MSKVAEDGRETYALLLAEGRFLLRDRGTQPATMWWGVHDRVPRRKLSGTTFQEHRRASDGFSRQRARDFTTRSVPSPRLL